METFKEVVDVKPQEKTEEKVKSEKLMPMEKIEAIMDKFTESLFGIKDDVNVNSESVEFEMSESDYDKPLGLLDDNNIEYIEDGKLSKETTYILNGNEYSTDEYGRITKCESSPQLTPENSRDINAQTTVGGENRLNGDQGGHIVGRDLGGDSGLGNLSPMDSRINQSDYKRMENDIKKSLDNGDTIIMSTELEYSGTSERPDKITSTVRANGVETIYTFDNNIDGSLVDKVNESCTKSDSAVLEDVIKDTDGKISSVKQEFDEDKNLVKTAVSVTYTGEDGKNYRRQVVISNEGGE